MSEYTIKACQQSNTKITESSASIKEMPKIEKQNVISSSARVCLSDDKTSGSSNKSRPKSPVQSKISGGSSKQGKLIAHEPTTRKSKTMRRGEKLNRVMNKLLKEHPAALELLKSESAQNQISRILGSRNAAVPEPGTASSRKRTVFVTFTSDNFHKVRTQYPDLKPNEIFRELARIWREEVSVNPTEVEYYTKKSHEFNRRLETSAPKVPRSVE